MKILLTVDKNNGIVLPSAGMPFDVMGKKESVCRTEIRSLRLCR